MLSQEAPDAQERSTPVSWVAMLHAPSSRELDDGLLSDAQQIPRNGDLARHLREHAAFEDAFLPLTVCHG